MVPLRASEMTEREKLAAREKVWEEKARAKEHQKRQQILERDAAKKRQAARDRQAEIEALRAEAIAKSEELARQRAVEDEKKRCVDQDAFRRPPPRVRPLNAIPLLLFEPDRNELAEQLQALEKEREREISERKRREGIEAERVAKEAAEQERLERASDLTLNLFANLRAVTKAKEAEEYDAPVDDYMSLLKKEQELKGGGAAADGDAVAEESEQLQDAALNVAEGDV